MANNPELTIKNLPVNELPKVNIWTRREGWNPGIHDLNLFYKYQPEAFFGGYCNDELVCIGSALKYNQNFTFLGYYIVQPNYRHHGYGIPLAKHLNAIAGNDVVGMDGVSNMAKSYEDLGFRTQYLTTRYRFKIIANKYHNTMKIRELGPDNAQEIIDYDARYISYDRKELLKLFIEQPDSITKIVYIDNKISGYGVMRKTYEGWRVGPLVTDSLEIASLLLNDLMQNSGGLNVDIDIPEYNQAAAEIIREFTMQKLFSTHRMYLHESRDILSNRVFGTMSLEVG